MSACKQLPILVGETDNITIDEVPRMVQGAPQWKRGRGVRGRMQEALRWHLGKDQRQSGAQWGDRCAEQNGCGDYICIFEEEQGNQRVGTTVSKGAGRAWG